MMPGPRLSWTHGERTPPDFVLHLTAHRSTKYGGLERYLVAATRRCRHMGLSTVVQYNDAPSSREYIADLEAAGASLEVCPLEGSGLRVMNRAARLVSRLRPTILHLHFGSKPVRLAAAASARLSASRLVVATVHTLPAPRLPLTECVAYALCDRVLPVSDQVRRRLAKYGVSGPRVQTLRLGVPAASAVPEASRAEVRRRMGIERGVVAMCIAFDHPVKGVPTLLDAFTSYVAPVGSDWQLVIVGIGPESSGLRSLAEGSVHAHQVHWVGIVDNAAALLAGADVYVQPSLAEGLGLAILEAMREGLPVVASAVGGIPEAVADGRTGLLVPPGDPVELAAALTTLMQDAELRDRMGQAGRSRVLAEFDLDSSIVSLTEVYLSSTGVA